MISTPFAGLAFSYSIRSLQRKKPLIPVRDGLLDYRALIRSESGQLTLGGR
jgi:hypothetical protein